MNNYHKGTISANVLIGFDADAIFNLFDSQSEDFGNITDLVVSNPNLFLFGYSSPRNIMQFEHTYGSQGNSGGGASTFKLKFIDPEVEFENRFLKNSSLQAQGLSVFSNDPSPFKNKYDFEGTPYGEWWSKRYVELQNEAFNDKNNQVTTRRLAYSQSIGGHLEYSGRTLYLDGDQPGSPTGGPAPDGTYQELLNISEWKAWKQQGSPEPKLLTKWDAPRKLIYSENQPSKFPHRYYSKRDHLTPETIKEISDQTTAELREAIKSQQDLLQTGVTTKIFVAYGMGYDLKSWAGPFITTLMGATNEYDSKGIRSLSIELVANIGSLGSGAREGRMSAGFGRKSRVKHEIKIKDFNAFGQGELKEKSSEEIAEVINYYKVQYGEGYVKKWQEEHSIDGELLPYRYLSDHVPGDLHNILTAVISKYVIATTSNNKIPIGNVVVLLPNLTKGLESVQAKVLTDVLTSNSVREDNEGEHWNLDTTLWSESSTEDAGRAQITQIKQISGRLLGDVSMRTVWGFQVVKKLIEALGLELTISPRNKRGSKDLAPESEATTQKYLEGLSFSAYKEFDPYDDGWFDEKNTQWSDSLIHFFGKSTNSSNNESSKKFEIVITNRFDENFEETLYRLLNDISSNSGLTFTPTVIWEQDTKFLKLLKDHGVIATDTQPAVLVGDKRIIDYFVYGAIEFQKVFKQEKAVSDFLNFIHPMDISRFSFNPINQAIAEGKSDEELVLQSEGEFPYCTAIFNKIYQPTYNAFDKLFHPHAGEAYNNPEQLVAAGLPIFRSGKKNSNILSMKADLKPYYFAGLFTNFLAERGSALTAGSGKLVSSKNIKEKNIDTVQKEDSTASEDQKIVEMFQSINPATKEALNALNSITEQEFGFKISSEEDYRDFLNLMMQITAGDSTSVPGNEGNPITTVIPSTGGRSAFLAVKDMVDHISQQTIQATIKTLPFFKLSGIQSLARPVIMDIREIQVASTPYSDNYNESQGNAFSTRIYSGFWNLFGFRHFISNKECFSEFTLYKQPGDADPNYGKIKEVTEEMKEALLEGTLESGEIYDITQVAAAKSSGGNITNNLVESGGNGKLETLNNVQKLNNEKEEQGSLKSEEESGKPTITFTLPMVYNNNTPLSFNIEESDCGYYIVMDRDTFDLFKDQYDRQNTDPAILEQAQAQGLISQATISKPTVTFKGIPPITGVDNNLYFLAGPKHIEIKEPYGSVKREDIKGFDKFFIYFPPSTLECVENFYQDED